MKYLVTFCAFIACFAIQPLMGQDTFSIVAVDPETGEVGSAGASCVELAAFNNLEPDFLGVLFPGEGAINTQAYWLPANQNNATSQFQSGATPEEIIDWLVINDVQFNPALRQYGVVRLIDDTPYSAAHTGVNTDAYKGHLTGPNYSIQGNILLGPEILEDMETNFVNTVGTLAEKLMAALQGANVVGADSRCADNGTSSLFAFLKVASPSDEFESPSVVLGVDFLDNTGIEPIDSLQTLFDELFPTTLSSNAVNQIDAKVYPIPADGKVFIELEVVEKMSIQFFNLVGALVYQQSITDDITTINQKQLGTENVYLYNLVNEAGQIVNSGKTIFQ